MAEFDRFLDRVAAGLPFEAAERLEILDELGLHIADTATALREDGLPADEAERRAIERLGDPDRLAHHLTQARRSPRRVLVAVGAGGRAVVGGAVQGLLLGTIVLLGASIVLGLSLNALRQIFATTWSGFDVPVSSALTVAVVAVGCYVAGRAITPVVAGRAGFPVGAVRPWTAGFGALAVAAYAAVGWVGPMGWPVAAGLASLPVWWVAGAWTGRRLQLGGRGFVAALVAGSLAMVAFVAVSMAHEALADPADRWHPTEPAASIDRIGAPTPASLARQLLGQGSLGFGSPGAVGGYAISVDVADASLLADWSDLRIEAWASDGPWSDGLAAAAEGPFLVAPTRWSAAGESPDFTLHWSSGEPWPASAATLWGSLQLDRTPGLDWARVGLTGLAPDGIRYRLSEPDLLPISFVGNLADWLAAVIPGGGDR